MGENMNAYLTEQSITFDPILEDTLTGEVYYQNPLQGIEIQENIEDDFDQKRVYSDIFLFLDQNINKELKDNSSFFFKKVINEFFKNLQEEKDYLDSEGIDPPNSESIGLFFYFLEKLAEKNIFPDKVSTSADEGICLKFVHSPLNLYFEIYNDGQLGYIVEDYQKKLIIENVDLDHINLAIKKIQEFLKKDYEVPPILITEE